MKRHLKVTVNGEEYQVTVEDVGDEDLSSPARPATRPQPRPVPTPEPAAEPEELEPAVEEKPVETPATGTRGDIEVSAPLAGTIRSITAKVGDDVSTGDTVLTLEALKLENEIVSPADGTIASVDVSVGDNVENGQLLLTIDSA